MSATSSLFLIPLATASLLCTTAVAWEVGGPPDIVPGSLVTTHYDGVSNDLLTAGLGASGLQSEVAPAVSATPTAEELRRLAIYTNYRALVDMTTSGGYGRFWGPNVAADGTITSGQGLIAGDETLAYAVQADGRGKITLMVQVPDSYDPAHGCIIAAPSSGSRGVYGAIATAGEWGLKHGCAVAYTDKGTGTGADDLQNNRVDLIRGEFVDAGDAGYLSQFTAALTPAQRAAYDAAFPNRFAFKHAHSQANPEHDWGQDVLQSVRFAFTVLNTRYAGTGQRITKANTIVIASSVSNGGGASLRAAEQDRDGLIDGVAVSEPNVNPIYDPRFTINQQGRPPLARHSRPLMDYITVENIYEGCAAAGYTTTQAPFNLAPSPARCASLHAAGLLTAADLAGQAAEAQAILNAYGFLPEQNLLQPVLWFSYVPQSIAVTYANAYGRFSVADNLCGFSFAAVDANAVPAPLPAAAEAVLFGTSNGIPPTAGISLINNAANLEDRASTPDQDLAGAFCLRSLATGYDPATGAVLPGPRLFQTFRILRGRRRDPRHRQPARRACGRGHRAQRRHPAAQLRLTRLFRPEQGRRGRAQPTPLLRGHERAAPGRHHRPGGLRHHPGAAAPLLHRGAGPDVCPSPQWHAAAREPGRPHHAARRHAGRGAGADAGERATDQRQPGGERDHVRRGCGEHPAIGGRKVWQHSAPGGDGRRQRDRERHAGQPISPPLGRILPNPCARRPPAGQEWHHEKAEMRQEQQREEPARVVPPLWRVRSSSSPIWPTAQRDT